MPDFEGNHTLPTNIVGGVFKGGNDSAAIYSRLYLGMDGTAMPGYRDAYGPDELWDVVHTVAADHHRGRPGAAGRRGRDGGGGDRGPGSGRQPTTRSLTNHGDEVVTYEERGASPILVWGGGALLLLVIVGSALLTSRRLGTRARRFAASRLMRVRRPAHPVGFSVGGAERQHEVAEPLDAFDRHRVVGGDAKAAH